MNPGPFLLELYFSNHFPSPGSSYSIEHFICSMCISSLDKNLIFNLLVYNNANSMLGNNRDSSVLPLEHLKDITFLIEPSPLMSIISPCMNIHIYIAKGITPCFPKGLETKHQEHISSFPLCLWFWQINGR